MKAVLEFFYAKVLHCVVPENIHTTPPSNPTEGNKNSEGRGVQQEAISEGVGSYLHRFFPPGGLSKTDELLIIITTASVLSKLSVILLLLVF